MKKVALVTYNELPNLVDGDNLLIDPFKTQGVEVVAAPWDKPDIKWGNFNIVILRSCWNYIDKFKEFTTWLDDLEKNKVNLWNPVQIIKWNSNKKYLLDLEKKGASIIPTKIFNKNNIKEIPEYLDSLEIYETIIIKPVIGNRSLNVVKINKNKFDINNVEFVNLINGTEVLIQPFLKEIEKDGEFSFVFFNKKYSHAMVKKPKQGEYRTHPDFGGIEYKFNPPENLIRQAEIILNNIESPLLYARVDGICVNGKLLLMELELIEPYLFFECEEKAPKSFVDAVKYYIF